MSTISSFTNEYSFLTLEYPCKINAFDVEFTSATALFYSFKTDDIKARRKFARLSPNKARTKGSAIQSDEFEYNVMDVLKKVLVMKFDQNPELKKKLLETKDMTLINTVTYRDQRLGIYNGSGKNYLGKALMAVRQTYLEGNNSVED